MLLNLPVIFSGNSFKIHLLYILKIIPTKNRLKINSNIVINTKRMYTIKTTTSDWQEMLSTTKDFLNCSHRDEKCLIVG